MKHCILLFLVIISGVIYADNVDCIHGNFPQIQAIYDGAIWSSETDDCLFISGDINLLLFQNRCSLFKDPGPPYKCKLIKDKSITLDPEPKLKEVEPQGDYGACYVGAALGNLNYNVEPTKKYSFSDAMCVGNKDRYKEGGDAISSLLKIAKAGSLLECDQQIISHEDTVLKIKKNKCIIEKILYTKQNLETEKEVLSEVRKIHENCKKTEVPPFSIAEISFEKEDEILDAISNVLKKQKMVLASVPDHIFNIYGINTYNCKNRKKSIMVKTMKILDPNGKKTEVVANDIVKGIYEKNNLFFLKREDRKIDIKDIYIGPKGVVYAAGTGDVDILKAYLGKSDSDVNIQRNDGVTPLFIAAQEGHKDVVAFLLNSQGIKVNKAINNDRITPLFMAAKNGHLDVVELFSKASEIEINKPTKNGRTPLFVAAENGQSNVVEFLLKLPEIKVNKPMDDGATPLIAAALNGHLNVVELLLNSPKIKINKPMNDGATPLIIATESGHLNIVKLFLKISEIEVNDSMNDGATPLIMAVKNRHLDVVKLLLKIPEIEVNEPMTDGVTPLIMAVKNGHQDVVELLLNSPKIEVNKAMDDGRTPLIMAAQYGSKDIVEFLLKNPEIDTKRQTEIGETPLYMASQEGQKDVVALLLNGPGIEFLNQEANNGATPLYISAQNGHQDVVELLLKEPNIKVNKATKNGVTPLIIGSSKGEREIVKILLESSDIILDMKYRGKTAEEWAIKNGFRDIAKFIRTKIVAKTRKN